MSIKPVSGPRFLFGDTIPAPCLPGFTITARKGHWMTATEGMGHYIMASANGNWELWELRWIMKGQPGARYEGVQLRFPSPSLVIRKTDRNTIDAFVCERR